MIIPTEIVLVSTQEIDPLVEEESPVLHEYKELEEKCNVVLEKIAKKKTRKSKK